MRVLAPRLARFENAVVGGEPDAHEVAAVASFDSAPSQACLDHRTLDLGAAEHLANSGPPKQLEGDGGGGGITRQAQQRRLAEQTEGQRLTRFHTYPPEIDI